jgi:hypothetical protein
MMIWTVYFLPSPRCRKCRTFRVFAVSEKEAEERALEMVRTATQGKGLLINIFEGEKHE